MLFNDCMLNKVNIIWATPFCACAAVRRLRYPHSASDLCMTLTNSPALPDTRPCQLLYLHTDTFPVMPKVRSTRQSMGRRSATRRGSGQPGRGWGQGSAQFHDTQGDNGQMRPPSPPRTCLTITTSCLSPLTACWASSARKWSGSSLIASNRLRHSWQAPQVVYGSHSSHRMYVQCFLWDALSRTECPLACCETIILYLRKEAIYCIQYYEFLE